MGNAGSAGNAMPAAVYEGRGVTRVVDRPVPNPTADQVLIEIGHCGICGSDLHLLVEGWGAPGTIAGHEYSGVIRALGSGVRGWAVGEAVVGGPPRACGRCRRCAAGQPSQCEDRAGTTGEQDGGGFARYVAVDAGRLVRLPEGLSPRTAALAEPLAVALHAVTRAELSPGDTVMVFGAGPIGALAVAALVADGRYPVTVVEPNEGRRQLALGIGAVAAVDPEVLERYEPWEPERRSPHAVDAVLECSGKRAAIE
ncbi:MAG: zinc-dependent alcohol dehydrogenase, partial [Acidimicrobiales bacterium]